VGSHRAGLTLGPDRFFDGRTFDPADIAGYLTSFRE
jgi:two-component system, oxyanion-binding sensor